MAQKKVFKPFKGTLPIYVPFTLFRTIIQLAKNNNVSVVSFLGDLTQQHIDENYEGSIFDED